MADYIHASILCESYIYIPEYELTEEKKKELTELLTDYAKKRAPILFSADVTVEVELIPGSLKAKVKILGSIVKVIAFYGGLRCGLDYLFKDSRLMAGAMAMESMFAASAGRQDVERVEMRTGVPGALKRVVARLDSISERLQRETSEASKKETLKDLGIAKNELLRILEALPSEEDREAVISGFEEIISENFPKPSAPSKGENNAMDVPTAALFRDELAAFQEELKKLREEAVAKKVKK